MYYLSEINKSNNQFFPEVLQVAVGTRTSLSATPSASDWQCIHDLASFHALTGVCFSALQQLPVEQQSCTPELLGRWFAQTEQIIQANAGQYRLIPRVAEDLQRQAVDVCLLKGQAVTLYYPQHLQSMRACGDIDVWAWEHDGAQTEIMKRCVTGVQQANGKMPNLRFHHVEYTREGIPVELHFRPTFLFTPWQNRRLWRWLDSQKRNFTRHKQLNICLPSTEFNLVYLAAHMFRHLFDEGIGLRQVMDYYYVLLSYEENKTEIVQVLRSLGLYRFAQALMYVLAVVFELPKRRLLVEPDTQSGERLLHRIMQTGAFGQEAAQRRFAGSSSKRTIAKTCTNMSLFRDYPIDTLAEPLFRIYHSLWRRFYNYV